MAKLAPTSIKYIIKAYLRAKGVVEKPDVIGAIFGQTEGLLGADLDLRELQKTGRIGRIEVNVKNVAGKSEGEIHIPSSLDSSETALIAAAIETIERIGPCDAEIELRGIEDARAMKRDYVIERAKELMRTQLSKGLPDISEVSEQIKESIKADEITSYHGLPCGPGILESEEIIVVEGRADVINLLKNGISNVIAIEGTSVPSAVASLTKEKTTVAFVDGDRGGELIIKELMQKTDLDFIVFAPDGKEVEELAKKEIYKALRNKIPIEDFKSGHRRELRTSFREMERKQEERRLDHEVAAETQEQPPAEEEEDVGMERPLRVTAKQKEHFKQVVDDLVGTRAACIFDEKNDLLGKVPVAELFNTLKTIDNPHTIIFDGRIDAKLNAIARKKGVKYLVGMEKDKLRSSVVLLAKPDLE
ncbi:MAG: DNA primase [Candidatus Aenigmarchaeota archaeon]|nr:DNA primase [Candidatus Aenigmarchaeota archaeon]